MSTYQPGDRTPIVSFAQLAERFEPEAPVTGRIGVEWELLPVRPDGHLAPYAGPGGVEEALRRISSGNRVVTERRHISAVELSAGGMVGLEPGGQIELATPPVAKLGALGTLVRRATRGLEASAKASGFRLAPWGVAPMDGEEDLPDVPKARYGILKRHLSEAGTCGRRMMKLTASSQISLDYRDETELSAMVGAALTALPYLLAFTANGPVYKGRLSRYATQRPRIWRGTDRRRCGLPAFLFAPRVTYAAAARWAMGRPLILLVRDGRFLPGDGRSFTEWLASPGVLGPMTIEDWDLHVSTLFPDLRLRHYLEIRVLDSLPFPLFLAAAAFLKGLLSPEGRETLARAGLPRRNRPEVARALLDAGREGPRWVPASGPAPDRAMRILLRAAGAGLEAAGEDAGALAALGELVERKACPADSWQRGSDGAWTGPPLWGTV